MREYNMNDSEQHFTFQRMMRFWSSCSEFTTDFQLALELSDDIAEQDALRPVLRAIILLYGSSRATLLEDTTFQSFLPLFVELTAIREAYADLWLQNAA